jgi:hypothetical protein
MKYTTIFSSTIKPLVSEEKDKYLAMASLLEVSDFVPELDTDTNIDLLPIAFNACVANRVNKNGDVIDTATALEIYKNFINKPINIEHNRQKVIGTILSASFSEFGTDRSLTAEEIKDTDKPFNITLGGVVWRIVNSELSELIEESNDPTSENYQGISASWELGFSDYDLVILEEYEKNIENGKTISSSVEKDELKQHLRSHGGTGLLDNGKRIYRKVVEQVVPLGIGLTETPAADVKGVAIDKEEDNEQYASESQETEPECPEITSQSSENNVNNKKDVVMKITSLKDINNDTLKTLEASAVHDFIQEELKKASEEFAAEKEEKETALKAANEKIDDLSANYDKVKDELQSVSDNLKTLEDENAAKAAEELFNQRMTSFDEKYELTDEDRKVIASDIKELDEEAYSAYTEKMAVLLSAKDKEAIAAVAAAVEEEAKASKEETAEEVVASEEETNEEVVEEALDNAEVEADAVATTTEPEEQTLYEKYKNAFSVDNFNIN